MLDSAAFTALLRDCYQRCWMIAAAITRDRADADDIVQEAAIVAFRRRAEFTQGTSFTAWISQIVRLTALNYVKKASRRTTVVTDPSEIDKERTSVNPNGDDARNSVSANGRLSRHQTVFDDDLLSALNKIGEMARACLLLHVVQQLPYDEIATILDIPSGTAMSHVHRAKRFLREQLKLTEQQSSNRKDNKPK